MASELRNVPDGKPNTTAPWSPQQDHQANSKLGSSGSVGIERGKPMKARAGMIAGRATYTVDEVAVLLDLSRGNAYRYVREGVIPAKRVGRRWMVPRKTFHAWLESCEAEAV